MPEITEFNFRVDRNVLFKFRFRLREKYTGVYVDFTTWEFKFTLTNGIDVDVWVLENSDFTRPDEFTIYFEKSIAEVNAMSIANYIPSLLATNADMIDNEIMGGIWYFV